MLLMLIRRHLPSAKTLPAHTPSSSARLIRTLSSICQANSRFPAAGIPPTIARHVVCQTQRLCLPRQAPLNLVPPRLAQSRVGDVISACLLCSVGLGGEQLRRGLRRLASARGAFPTEFLFGPARCKALPWLAPSVQERKLKAVCCSPEV